MEGKVVLVTGELEGIGRSTVALLAEEGAQVFAADVDETDGNPIHLTRTDHGRQTESLAGITYLSVDVRDEDAWPGMVGDILRRFGRLDLLVNIAETGGVEADRARQFPVNVSLEVWPAVSGNGSKGLLPGCQHAIKAMLWSGGGSIINICSNSDSETGSDSLSESDPLSSSGSVLGSSSYEAGDCLHVIGNPREVAGSVLQLALDADGFQEAHGKADGGIPATNIAAARTAAPKQQNR